MSDAREAASSKELSEDDYPGFATDTVAGKFVPSKYQGLYIAASAMSVVGSAIGTPMIGWQLETSGNSQFLRNRENALDRLIDRM